MLVLFWDDGEDLSYMQPDDVRVSGSGDLVLTGFQGPVQARLIVFAVDPTVHAGLNLRSLLAGSLPLQTPAPPNRIVAFKAACQHLQDGTPVAAMTAVGAGSGSR
jgi:hypothetical protein